MMFHAFGNMGSRPERDSPAVVCNDVLIYESSELKCLRNAGFVVEALSHITETLRFCLTTPLPT